jgi:hypothetical protein
MSRLGDLGNRTCRFAIEFMNVSWSDLNNVEQAGEYPFRDRTITVTFAEIAVCTRNFS